MFLTHYVNEMVEVESLINYFNSLEKKHERQRPFRSDKRIRSRVRYWLNDIVDEMRKKSPASVQKWVDSIQIPAAEGGGGTEPPGSSTGDLAEQQQLQEVAMVHEAALTEPVLGSIDSVELSSDLEKDSIENVLRMEATASTSGDHCVAGSSTAPVDLKPDGGSSMSIKSLLSKKSILGKFSRSSNTLEQENPAVREPETQAQEEESRKASSLASIGKTKINEFYDKLSMNKAKYNLVKAKKLDIRNMLGASKENLSQKVQQQQQAADDEMEECVTVKELAIEKSAPECIVDILTEEEDDRNTKIDRSEASTKLSAGDIYEFSFDESFPKDEDIPDVSEDEEKENIEVPQPMYENYLKPNKSYHRMGIGQIGRSSSENPRANKRLNMLDIGRSFSEMNDDDTFVINECNNSCPNPSSLNTSSSINNSSTNILARSVPVSPIPRTGSKISIQQENSLSESPRRRSTMLMKDSSLQSDSSRCSSVESLLNARKPDPERILLNLGFGPAPHSTDILSKIPKRFLKPSQVRGVDTEAFLRQQQLSMHIHENSVLGYRGLVGNPHIPPSMIVAKIMERFQENERGRLVRSGSAGPGIIGLSSSAPTAGQMDSHHSSGPPSPVPFPRHSSLASEGRVKF